MLYRWMEHKDADFLDLGLDLEPTGVAILFVQATVRTVCPHLLTHEHTVQGEVACNSRLNKEDMDDVEWAIRGDREAGLRLGWRTVFELVERLGTDPCEAAGEEGSKGHHRPRGIRTRAEPDDVAGDAAGG